jgi:hypothetical protein
MNGCIAILYLFLNNFLAHRWLRACESTTIAVYATEENTRGHKQRIFSHVCMYIGTYYLCLCLFQGSSGPLSARLVDWPPPNYGKLVNKALIASK